MIRVKLTKLSDNVNALRTKTVEGACFELPKVGSRFLIMGEGLTGGTRSVLTSTVKSLQVEGNTYVFDTENSKYSVEKVD